ncbi:hypothetical protein EV426DRAFT_579812 [Tirmania nivea]|nr:hypothetical protein EV426DRAFT_579812 [Tirmania nivea]
MAHTGPSAKEASSGECSSQGGGIKSNVPPTAHIPKPKAKAGSHRKDSAQISRATSPKELEYSKPRIPSGTISPLGAQHISAAKETLNAPFSSKIQNIWDNCVKTFTTNPFGKISTGKDEDTRRTPRQQKGDKKKIQVGAGRELNGTEDVVQECMTGRTWWDFPMAMQGFRALNPSQNSDTSHLQNTIFRASARESFQEAKAYGFRKVGADQENDSTITKNIQKQEDKSVPMANKNEIHKTGQYDAYTRGYEVEPTQQNSADSMLPKADNLKLEISNLDGHTDHISSLHMDQKSAVQQPVSAGKMPEVQLSKGKQVEGCLSGSKSQTVDLIGADTSRGDAKVILMDIDHEGLEKPASDEPSWVHRWLDSYSTSQESPKTAVVNSRQVRVQECPAEGVAPARLLGGT